MEDKVESRGVSGRYVLSPSQEMRNPGRMAQRDQERASRDFSSVRAWILRCEGALS